MDDDESGLLSSCCCMFVAEASLCWELAVLYSLSEVVQSARTCMTVCVRETVSGGY